MLGLFIFHVERCRPYCCKLQLVALVWAWSKPATAMLPELTVVASDLTGQVQSMLPDTLCARGHY